MMTSIIIAREKGVRAYSKRNHVQLLIARIYMIAVYDLRGGPILSLFDIRKQKMRNVSISLLETIIRKKKLRKFVNKCRNVKNEIKKEVERKEEKYKVTLETLEYIQSLLKKYEITPLYKYLKKHRKFKAK